MQVLYHSTAEFPLRLTFHIQYAQSLSETTSPWAAYAEFHAEEGIGNSGLTLK